MDFIRISKPVKNDMIDIKPILIIEDDEIDRKVMLLYLESETPNIEIVESCDCVERFSEMAKLHFDCILLDYQLPDGDGVEFLQKLMLRDV